MKKILTVYTGGTICSSPEDGQRKLNSTIAKRALICNYAASDSEYAPLTESLFADSKFDTEHQTLSENMTPARLSCILNHISGFSQKDYSGIIVMHGTDTLAYTAALFAFAFSNTGIPVMLVSGNRPPMDEKSNANANFRTAVELIMKNIAPNVYVPYRNSDGNTYLHLASTLMSCNNFSEDFFNASPDNVMLIKSDYSNDYSCEASLFSHFAKLSSGRTSHDMASPSELSDRVPLIIPYTGLDYSLLAIPDNARAIVHGTYHSGTVCVERNNAAGSFSSHSILWLMDKCTAMNIPLIISPSCLDSEQYSSAYDAAAYADAIILNMTTEAAYMKTLWGISLNLTGDALTDYLNGNVNNEFISR